SLSSAVIKRDISTELKKIATKREEPKTMERVIGKYFMNSPMMPGQRPRGTKAATVVRVEMMMGKAISPIPCLEAWILDIPSSSIRRYTFSTTTIPLSTNIPRPMIRPKRIMVFMVYPRPFKIINAMNMESGMAKPTKRAFLNPRKNINTVTTRMIPKMMLFIKSSTIPTVVEDWSLEMLTFRSWG